MSGVVDTGTETTLVNAESTVYDRGLDGIIALGVVSFALGLVALVGGVALDASGTPLARFFLRLLAAVGGAIGAVGIASWANVAPVASRRVRGIGVGVLFATTALTAVAFAVEVTLATLLGAILIVDAAGVVAAGLCSRAGLVDTLPDPSAGLLAGGAFGTIGLVVGAALGGSLVGFDSLTWLLLALLTGLGLAIATVAPREDVGSTLAPALVVGALGLTIATATIGVGWQWNPKALSGGFTGGAVIPLFVLFSALVSSWAAAKCRAGFGAEGREYGAFLVINLTAFLMLAVMVAIVVFVTMKGVGYAFHGLTIGAVSALVLLAPLLALTTRFARTPVGTTEWNTGVRYLVRVLPLGTVGSVATVVASVLVTASPLAYPFTYTVQVNRKPKALDTAVTVTPEPTVGSLLLALSGLVLSVYFYRQYGSLRNVGTETDRIETIRTAVPLTVVGLLLFAVLFGLVGPRPLGLPVAGTLGILLVDLGSVATLALVVSPFVGILAGEGDLGERVQDRATLVTLGVFGGLGLATATLALQQAAGITPSVGPVNVLPAVALTAAVALVGLAALTAAARRTAEESLRRRLLSEEATLALAGMAGFVTVAGLHVELRNTAFTVLGVSISQDGTLSWPMTMQAYIPLGPEPGGIMPAVVGTVWLVVGATLFAVPLGLGAAVFLTEYAEQGRFTTVVEVATNALWSTPSVVFGLFGAAFLIPRLGGDTSLLAGMFVLGFMLLPLILITSREAIKAVPDEYRDASAALGATRWQTIRSVVLPAAMPGVITGGILGIGRIAGETAPLILVLGSTLNPTESVHVLRGFRFVSHPPFVVNDQLLSASASLPTQVWAVIAAGVSGSPAMGWATAFILLMVVLSFYAVGITARIYFRKKVTHD
ncbi:MAG: phosphate ABC transporter permease PstA [Halopenitus sp.]